MYASPISVPAERGGSAGSPPPVPPHNDDHDNDNTPAARVPPAEAERPKGVFGRLLEILSTPGESNFDNP